MASEIQYALYKANTGLWSKLLSPGHKVRRVSSIVYFTLSVYTQMLYLTAV